MDAIPSVLRNLHKPKLGVRHSDLERYDLPTSVYKSVCPNDDCNGLLLVQRDSKTFKIRAQDHCTLCAQQVVYLDVKRMRKELG